MTNPTERIPDIRLAIMVNQDMEPPKRPSKMYRMAVAPKKSPFDFKKTKKRRKMAKVSRRINRK